MYVEYFKLRIVFPLPLFITDILHFWNLSLAQIHLLFSLALVGFNIICGALSIPTGAIIKCHYKVHDAETNSGWFICAVKLIWAYSPNLLLLNLGRIDYPLFVPPIFLLSVSGLPVGLFLIRR